MTNEELYLQYLSGDTEAFEQLYLQMQGSSHLLQKTRRRASAVRTKKYWMNCAPKALWSFVSAFLLGSMTKNVEN